ncbi:MAG: hypothetical protein F4030_01695 [Gammaproteobacteria bacterium]|nr:hypothetical protein [Gammaproteobacteria bacterium]MYF78999.1 hypothetical protein [Chloroflexota bacterium]MYK03686.1 hypothetical protein [Gammaproteobacteria bacterium]
MERMIDSLARYSRLKLLLIFFLIIEISIRTGEYLIYFIDPVSHENSLGSQSYVIEYFFSQPLILSLFLFNVVGPLIETLIFQVLILLTIKKLTEWILKSDSWLPALVMATLAFAAVHGLEYTNWYYWTINASIRLPISFVLALAAVVEYNKENGRPILVVFFCMPCITPSNPFFYSLRLHNPAKI